jgi:glycosyltransferase involved in cell wall biosynthesis
MKVERHSYSDGVNDIRIAILGPLPPPFGGVSVHVQRVVAKLRKQGCTVHAINSCAEYRYRYAYFYLIRLALLLWYHRFDQVHVHTLYLSNGLRELALIMYVQRYLHYEVMLIEHDCRYLYTKDVAWRTQLNNLLPHVKQHVYIGDRTARSFVENNIVPAYNVSVESAFLPPDSCAEHEIVATYPSELFAFIDRYTNIMLANAFALSLLDGKDLYGFDLCVKALALLRKDGYDVGLVFALAQVSDEQYFSCCMHMIEQYGLQEHIFLLTGRYELWPLMKMADIFIRPTLSDGASVSVEEALWCGANVIASDVCARPEGVVLFKSGNIDDLCCKLKEFF